MSAQDQVAITRSALEKRRIDREIEEAEDWFRKRQRQQEAAALVERKKDEAIVAEQRRRRWMQGWMRYALNSVPYGARGEVEIEVHGEVEAALSKLQADEPEAILRPLVDAAVRRALRPWQHKQDLQTPRDIWGSVGNAISVPEIHHIGAYFGFPYRETRLLRVRHPEAS